jgi:hypothetical protein
MTMADEYRDKCQHDSKITLARSHPHDLLRTEAIRQARRLSGAHRASHRFHMGAQCSAFSNRVLNDLFGKKFGV